MYILLYIYIYIYIYIHLNKVSIRIINYPNTYYDDQLFY